MKLSRLILFLSLLAHPLSGQETKAPPPEFIVECQMVRVPAKALVTLVPELSDDATSPAAWERVQAMIARGEATLAGYLLGKGPERQTITAESLEELRYADELAFPTRPPDFNFSPRSAELLKFWPYIGILPTAFETAKLGQFVDVTVRRTTDPRLLDCAISIRHLEFLGYRRFPAGRLENGEQLTYEQPRWSEMRDLANLLVTLGQPVLAGVHSVPGEKQMFELFILRINGGSRAGQAKPDTNWKVRADVQIVALSVAEALRLIPRLRNPVEAAEATKEVQAMIVSDRADLLGWPIVSLDTTFERLGLQTIEGGEMAASKSFEVVRYPVVFGPPQIPGGPAPRPPGPILSLEERLSPSISAPYAFDARNVGHELEATAIVDAERRVRLIASCRLVVLRAMEPALCVHVNRPSSESIHQPRFLSTRAEADVTVPSGGSALLGTCMERGARPRVILFLLHATARPSSALLP